MTLFDRKLILWPLFLLLASGCTRGCGSSQNGGTSPLHADRGFQFPPRFPEDPGDAGRKTLEGIDADRDGLRDDLQRWIHARYPNDESKRKALTQMARSFQAEMKTPTTREEIEAHAKRIARANECLSQRFASAVAAAGEPAQLPEAIEMEYIRAKVLNTKERPERYFETDSEYDGKVFDGLSDEEKRTACDT